MISIGPLAPLFDYSRTSGGWREHSNNSDLAKLLNGDDAVRNPGGDVGMSGYHFFSDIRITSILKIEKNIVRKSYLMKLN